MFAAIWGSPMLIGDKVYLGDEDGDVAVVEHSKTFKLVSEQNMGSSVYSTVITANGAGGDGAGVPGLHAPPANPDSLDPRALRKLTNDLQSALAQLSALDHRLGYPSTALEVDALSGALDDFARAVAIRFPAPGAAAKICRPQLAARIAMPNTKTRQPKTKAKTLPPRSKVKRPSGARPTRA